MNGFNYKTYIEPLKTLIAQQNIKIESLEKEIKGLIKSSDFQFKNHENLIEGKKKKIEELEKKVQKNIAQLSTQIGLPPNQQDWIVQIVLNKQNVSVLENKLKEKISFIEKFNKEIKVYDESSIKDFDDLKYRFSRNITYCYIKIKDLEEKLVSFQLIMKRNSDFEVESRERIEVLESEILRLKKTKLAKDQLIFLCPKCYHYMDLNELEFVPAIVVGANNSYKCPFCENNEFKILEKELKEVS